ncbi:MAG: hypothetical protein RSB96_03060, partial [Oscillospiraceae bacterium]
KHFNESSEKNMDTQTMIEKSYQTLTLDTKQTTQLKQYLHNLKSMANIGNIYKEKLKTKVVRSYALSEPNLSIDIIKSITEKMSFDELLAYEKVIKSKVNRPHLQLANPSDYATSQDQFKL